MTCPHSLSTKATNSTAQITQITGCMDSAARVAPSKARIK